MDQGFIFDDFTYFRKKEGRIEKMSDKVMYQEAAGSTVTFGRQRLTKLCRPPGAVAAAGRYGTSLQTGTEHHYIQGDYDTGTRIKPPGWKAVPGQAGGSCGGYPRAGADSDGTNPAGGGFFLAVRSGPSDEIRGVILPPSAWMRIPFCPPVFAQFPTRQVDHCRPSFRRIRRLPGA